MFVYSAKREKVQLDHLPTSIETYEGYPIVSVSGREYAPAIAKRVTLAAQSLLEMASRSHPVRSSRLARVSAPPAVFEEAETGVIRMVHREVVLRFQPDIKVKTRRLILKKHGLRVRSQNEYIGTQVVAYQPDVSKAGAAMIGIANDCAEMDELAFATPNFISEFRRDQIPAPHIEQWHLRNRGSVVGQVAGEDVDARTAWKTTMGKRSIVIAVLDDGVDIGHPNLKPNIKAGGRDFFIADDDDPDHLDPRPKLFRYPYHRMAGNDIHGTPCAGVIAACGKKDKVYGIAPKCRILPIKIFHADDLASDARVADAIRYAALNADILSCSWSGPRSADIELAIQDAQTLGRNGKGAAVFCASGNNGQNWISYPAAFNKAIAVGASTDGAKLASYSQYGPEQWVVAPSSGGKRGIYTTDVSNPNRGFNAGRDSAGGADGLHTNDFGGTSSATPLAAGIAALVLSVKSSLDADSVKQVLADTADKIGTGYNAGGFSKKYGYGRVNAAKAVEAALQM